MEGYSVKIGYVSRDISAKERVMLKDTTGATKLDEATHEESVIIDPDMYAVLDVHNEKSDNVDYEVYVILDKSGEKFVTGSKSFWDSFNNIMEEMEDANEAFQIKCFRVPSKNYKGKDFLSCSII